MLTILGTVCTQVRFCFFAPTRPNDSFWQGKKREDPKRVKKKEEIFLTPSASVAESVITPLGSVISDKP